MLILLLLRQQQMLEVEQEGDIHCGSQATT